MFGYVFTCFHPSESAWLPPACICLPGCGGECGRPLVGLGKCGWSPGCWLDCWNGRPTSTNDRAAQKKPHLEHETILDLRYPSIPLFWESWGGEQGTAYCNFQLLILIWEVYVIGWIGVEWCRPWKGKRSVSFNNGMWWESYLEYPWVALLFFRPAYPGCKRLIYIDLYWFIMFEVLHFTVGGVMRFYILAPVDPASPTQRVLIAFEAFWSIGIWLGTGCFTNVLAWHANVLSESCH